MARPRGPAYFEHAKTHRYGCRHPLVWIDRTNRAKTGDARVPKGKYSDVREPLGDFRKQRQTIRNYAETTKDDAWSRMLLEGNMDVYRWLLMIFTHSQRHILQIREIKAHASYPRLR